MIRECDLSSYVYQSFFLIEKKICCMETRYDISRVYVGCNISKSSQPDTPSPSTVADARSIVQKGLT